MNLISVDIAAANKDMLEDAVKALGYVYTRNKDKFDISTPGGYVIEINGNKAKIPPNAQKALNKIKQEYSNQVIKYISKKYKFTQGKTEEKIVLRKY